METHFETAGAKGSCFALKATVYTEFIALSIAFTFAATVGGLRYLADTFAAIGYTNALCFVILTAIFAHILGKRAGISISKKSDCRFLISYTTGFLIVFSATLITSMIALLMEAFSVGLPANWFALYIIKPIIWLFCASCLPVIIAGSWYGFKLGT
jgi:hypothetical protein